MSLIQSSYDEYRKKVAELLDDKRYMEMLEITEGGKELYPEDIMTSVWYSHAFYRVNRGSNDPEKIQEMEQKYKDALNLMYRKQEYAHLSDIYNDLGNYYKSYKREYDAISSFMTALYYHKYNKEDPTPDRTKSHFFFNMSDAMFKIQDHREGWSLYKYLHINMEHLERDVVPSIKLWDDMKPHLDKTILVHNEQAFGDLVMYVRFLKFLESYFGHIVMETPCKAKYMFQGCTIASDKVEFRTGEPHYANLSNVPDVHYHINLDQLVYTYNKIVGNYESGHIDYLLDSIPYFKVPEEDIKQWHTLVDKYPNKIRIAVNWCGQLLNTMEGERKVPLSMFKLINEIPFVQLFIIQKVQGLDALDEIKTWNYPERVTILSHDIDKVDRYRDTMAIFKNVHLVLSSDTSIVHVSGAMDVPTWALINYFSEWRWGHDKLTHNFWYKSVKIFKQVRFYDWTEPFAEVIAELFKLKDTLGI